LIVGPICWPLLLFAAMLGGAADTIRTARVTPTWNDDGHDVRFRDHRSHPRRGGRPGAARARQCRTRREGGSLSQERTHPLRGARPRDQAVLRTSLRGKRLQHDEGGELAQGLGAPPRAAIDPPGATNESTPVHERRAAATMVLIQSKDCLGASDADLIAHLLREAKTWALVDPLAEDLVGPLSEDGAGFDRTIERWAIDEDFWIRRSALLTHLVPLRQGRGDFDRFSRFADAMLEDREVFIRKAISWVLRDTSRKRPDL